MSNKIPVFSADELRAVIPGEGGNLVEQEADTDWQDELSQTGISKKIGFSIDGAAAEKFSYYASLGVQDQEGFKGRKQHFSFRPFF